MTEPHDDLDPAAELRADVKKILAAVVGGLDPSGTHHRGLMDRVAALERALTWLIGIGTAAVMALVSAFAAGLGPHK